ncbi:hypothetical protein GUITHDRAFT_111616 [Guillardia theta CCMP2712]|uniref:PDZ domain-containing protein n=1 Tax=Guillardia theta (strain CCMP2712) TaxID=905079 RepID=L1J1G3_GUITC|nr:hypothetical protein GUITHDRAFT_111616 [Guillardia theta CCMP2712]EKX42341.1 hypothetical protein GUITHDRAFT_111616 [Guillardia theta CCMP2712]|eukprot:XP_005829321.1 hypothetical protein GUITHDRAFT_111616 [Guillardia theta CCMP2712]
MEYVIAEEYHAPNNGRAASSMEYYSPKGKAASHLEYYSNKGRTTSSMEYFSPKELDHPYNGRPASGSSTYSFPELPLKPQDLPKPVIPRPVVGHGLVINSRLASSYQPNYEGKSSGRTLSLPAYTGSNTSSLPSMHSSASTVFADAEQDGSFSESETRSPKRDEEVRAGVGLLIHEKVDKSTGLVCRLVQDVLPDSDAAKNGVRVGDELIAGAVLVAHFEDGESRTEQWTVNGSTVRIDLKRLSGRFKGIVYFVDLVRRPLVGVSHRSTQATVKELHDLTPEQQAVLVTVHLCTIS